MAGAGLDQQGEVMGNLLWSSDRPEFCERIAKLAGGTTYREPWAAGGGGAGDTLPDAHAIATALAFARQGQRDIGPDVAYCIVLRTDAYRQIVVTRLAEALGDMDGRELRHARVFALPAALAAWDAVVHVKGGHKRPHGCQQHTWDKLLLTAIATLHDKAWDAVAEAERRYSRAA